eukprot:6073020-Ditylum_brightwellii.AAC.1
MKNDLLTHIQKLEKRVQESSTDEREPGQEAYEPMDRQHHRHDIDTMPTATEQDTIFDNSKAAAFLRNCDLELGPEDGSVSSLEEFLGNNGIENHRADGRCDTTGGDKTPLHYPSQKIKGTSKEEECEQLKFRVRELEQW